MKDTAYTQLIIGKINDLYITLRKKYLYMDKTGNYATFQQGKGNTIPLHDSLIKRHIEGSATYGVFSPTKFTNFICLDVDLKDNSKWATYKLVDTLINEFGIAEEHIIVSISGSKGYHVELFFDEFISLRTAVKFYEQVIAEVIDIEKSLKIKNLSDKIEFRPKHTEGVKIPLGIHQKTGKRCWYTDTITLEPIETFDYIFNIKKMSSQEFIDIVNERVTEEVGQEDKIFTKREKIDYESVVQSLNLKGKSKQEIVSKAERLLSLGQLELPHTRHNMTVLLATWFNERGTSIETAKGTILSILENTPANYFNNPDGDFIEKETNRLVEIVYQNDYRIQGQNKEVYLAKSEVLEILKAKTLNEKKLLYAMAVHSKRNAKLDGTFYMAYSVISEMTGLSKTNRANILKMLLNLEKKGLLKIIQRSKVDKTLTKERGEVVHETNIYKLTLPEPSDSEQYFSISPTHIPNFFDVVSKLVNEKECKTIVDRTQFYRHFKKLAY